jgi:hypothetical protein
MGLAAFGEPPERRFIHHLGATPGEVVNNSPFFAANFVMF